jgi:hypothetical protein
MGAEGTHPWAQGFPLTTQIEGGPSIPSQISFSSLDLKYPPATGILKISHKYLLSNCFVSSFGEENQSFV